MEANILRLWPEFSNHEGKIKLITYEDLLYLKRKCKVVKKVSIEALGDKYTSSQQIIIEDRKYFFGPPSGMVIGIIPDYQKIKSLRVVKGRFINEIDIKLKRRVCVVGNTLYIFLGGEKIIGKKLKVLHPKFPSWISKEEILPIPKESFTVIGALARVKPFTLPIFNADFWCKENGTIFIPYTIISEVMEGGNVQNREFLGQILIQIVTDKKEEPTSFPISENEWKKKIKKGEWVYSEKEGLDVHKSVEKEARAIINTLKEKYGKDKKFYISSASRLLDELKSQTKQANTFIAIIGGVSLIISVIGILSIMLLSVTNRTSDIGIRRAFGVRKKDIFFQFITEAMVISGVGGIIGIILGIGGSYLIGWYASWEVVIPWWSIVLALLTTIIIAMIGGIYPAMKATSILKGEAVKYE